MNTACLFMNMAIQYRLPIDKILKSYVNSVMVRLSHRVGILPNFEPTLQALILLNENSLNTVRER